MSVAVAVAVAVAAASSSNSGGSSSNSSSGRCCSSSCSPAAAGSAQATVAEVVAVVEGRRGTGRGAAIVISSTLNFCSGRPAQEDLLVLPKLLSRRLPELVAGTWL